MYGYDGRPVAVAASCTTLATLGTFATLALISSTFAWSEAITWKAIALILIPSVALTVSVGSTRFRLAWAMYWAWSFVFLGLAPAYQLSRNSFPWGGHHLADHASQAQTIILVGHASVLFGYIFTRRYGKTRSDLKSWHSTERLERWMRQLLQVHLFAVTAFCLLMGPALVSGRKEFNIGLAANENLLGFGTLYFVTNAGAIILPAAAITLRKRGMHLSRGLIATSLVASFVATNPFIGSRFFTGSFLVAVTAALASTLARRWIPIGIVLAFVTVFPTLDLLRGDNTGADKVEAATPSQNLRSFDFDAFEMLVRSVATTHSLDSAIPQGELLVAPFLRWVPVVSKMVQGDASGPYVAHATGMGYTNVSMPLWGEAFLIGGFGLVVVSFFLLGVLLARAGGSTFARVVEAPIAALLVIILRGSLYEVLGYLLLALFLSRLLATGAVRSDADQVDEASRRRVALSLHRHTRHN